MDITKYKRVQEFWFPKEDSGGCGVIFNEARKINQICKLCSKTRTVIQAGANVGVFPAYLASIFDLVITFEPDPRNYECAVENLKHYDNYWLYNAGLGSSMSKGITYQPEKMEHMYVNCGSISMKETEDGDINITTIDMMKAKDVDLIYLDVEGWEAKALIGARATIRESKPVIVTENKGLIPMYPGTFEGSQDFRDWVCTLGYRHHSRLMRDDVFVPL